MPNQNYSSLLKIFEEHLHNNQPVGAPDTLYKPMRYINGLGGKRIRPVLLLMAYNLWHKDVTPALPAALAIEYFHNFSLMHDDIMDEAPTRRGKESVHIHFDRNAAILAGDSLLIKSFELMIELEQRLKLNSSIALEMAKTSLEICEGQQMDIDYETHTSPTEDEYIEMIRKKTACLIGASLRIGSLIAGASAEVSNSLYSFGVNLGLAFQIKDDALDAFGDPALTGKQKGGDILRGKKSFLFVHVVNSLSGNERNNFIETFSKASTENNISDVLEVYDSLNVEKYVREKEQYYFKLAMNSIQELKDHDTSMLESFALELMEREY